MADCVVGALECVAPLPPFCHNDSYLDELGLTVLSMNWVGFQNILVNLSSLILLMQLRLVFVLVAV